MIQAEVPTGVRLVMPPMDAPGDGGDGLPPVPAADPGAYPLPPVAGD